MDITSFWLDCCTKSIYKKISSALVKGKLPKLANIGILVGENSKRLCVKSTELDKLESLKSLTIHNFIRGDEDLWHLGSKMTKSTLKINRLDISYSKGITGNLLSLFCYCFQSLYTLILSDCGLNSYDLSSLAYANVEGRLPKLRHLDISCNGHLKTFTGFKQLFRFSSKWNQLLSLDISETRDLRHLYPSFLEIVGYDCLRSLEKISFSIDYFDRFRRCMRNIRTIHIFIQDEKRIDVISEEKKDDLLPSLQTVCIKFAERSPKPMNRLFEINGVRKLTDLNVPCHLAVSPEPPFSPRRCQCEPFAATFT